MLDVIDRNCKTALSAQVSERLIQDIRSGQIKPGKRMPGERQLAQRFGISRGTVIEALNLMEQQNYIERIPAKGTFVADDVDHELSMVKIAFPFPEASISPNTLGSLENWGIVSEVYRGMIDEAGRQNAEISFLHFDEAGTEIQLARQLRRLDNIDAAIFIGHQLSRLRQALRKDMKICVSIDSAPFVVDEEIIITDNLRGGFEDMAAFARNRNYQRLHIISKAPNYLRDIDKKKHVQRLQTVLQAFKQANIETSRNYLYEFDDFKIEDFANIFKQNNLGRESQTDLIFIATTSLVPEFYAYCLDAGIKLGEDIGAFGYASGITFSNLAPAFAYSKVDYFEMGKRACAKCISALRSDKKVNSTELINNLLIKGKSI
ncbi:MAG: GntR family transcriptional regulator [Victivallales bacterium]